MFTADDFWIPDFKWQLVQWLTKHYPTAINGDIIPWSKYPKRQLLAIYMEKRRKDERQRKTAPAPKEDKERVRPEQLVFNF